MTTQLKQSASPCAGRDNVLKPVSSAPWIGNDAEAADCEAMARALQKYFSADSRAERDTCDGCKQHSLFDMRSALGSAVTSTASTALLGNVASEDTDCDNMALAIARFFPGSLASNSEAKATTRSQDIQGDRSFGNADIKSRSVLASMPSTNAHQSTSTQALSKDIGKDAGKPPEAVPSAKKKGASALLKGLRSGEVSKLVDDMEAGQDVLGLAPEELPREAQTSNSNGERAVPETHCLRKEWFDAVTLDSESVFANASGSVHSWSVASVPDEKEDVADMAVFNRLAKNATEMEDLRQLGPSMAEQHREVTSRASGELLQYSPSPWPSTGGTPAPTTANAEKYRCQSSNSFWELQSPSPFEAQAVCSPSPFEPEAALRRLPNARGLNATMPERERPELPEVTESLSEVDHTLQPIKGMRLLGDAELSKSNEELRQHIKHLKAEVERRRREQCVLSALPETAIQAIATE